MEASWDDLKLFLIVAECGGLSSAAARTGLSAPTIGRRMVTLERTMNRVLFERSRRGYVLAKDGITLLDRVREMQRISADITDWHGGAFRDPVVEIASNSWLSMFFSSNGHHLSFGPGDVRCGYTDGHDWPHIVMRDRLIYVTFEPPTSGNYAILPSVLVRFAAYKGKGCPSDEETPWVSIGKECSFMPSDRWVFEQFDREIYSWTNHPYLLLRLLTSDRGRGVLPCFIGDAEETLVRAGEVIETLTSRLYIVVNDDDRRRPEVRLMMDRVATLLGSRAKLFAGELGS